MNVIYAAGSTRESGVEAFIDIRRLVVVDDDRYKRMMTQFILEHKDPWYEDIGGG